MSEASDKEFGALDEVKVEPEISKASDEDFSKLIEVQIKPV